MICISLEPGSDGVGDYVAGLARAIGARGVKVNLLALADRFIEQPRGFSKAGIAAVARIPFWMPVRERYDLARRAIESWNPDWVSLQFVSWGYGWNGIVFGQSIHLARLLKGRPRHVMFHEPWIFIWPGNPHRVRRQLWLGQAQRISLFVMNRFIRPQIVHTSNAYYARLLETIGVKAKLLPMFGNVPVSDVRDWPSLRDNMVARGVVEADRPRDNILLIGLFGEIRPFPTSDLFMEILKAAGTDGRRAIVISFGLAGARAERALADWKKKFPEIAFGQTGRLDGPALSACINELDACVSTHPIHLIGRSGAAAAVLEHGTPIITCWGIAPSASDLFFAKWRKLVWSVDDGLSTKLSCSPRRSQSVDAARTAADMLLSDLRSSDQLISSADLR